MLGRSVKVEFWHTKELMLGWSGYQGKREVGNVLDFSYFYSSWLTRKKRRIGVRWYVLPRAKRN